MTVRILIADDHPIIVAGVEALLRGSDYSVVAQARDGAELLDAIGTARPDILIVDVQMPERSGIDVLRILRSRGDQRPVILLTASLDDFRLIEAIQLGVNGIVLKEGAHHLLFDCLDVVRSGGRWIDRALMDRALDRALADPSTREGAFAALTTRERAVVSLVAQGRRNKEIAAELGITEGTVKVYLHRIYERIGVTNRTELALWAKEQESA